MDPLRAQALSDLRDRLLVTPYGERGELITSVCASLGLSKDVVYKGLKSMGWSSGRKPRSDKGTTSIPDATLRQAAGLMAQAVNKRGKPNLPLSEAKRMLEEVGQLPDVSYSQLARALNARSMGPRAITAAKAAISRVSVHPNQTHFFDISVALQWRFAKPETAELLEQYAHPERIFYEGKRENFTALRRIIHRFVLTDHYSGAYFVRYYYTSGEIATDVVDFLYRAWTGKKFHAAYPFRGLPKILCTDQGSANKSGLVQELLKNLGIDAELHMPGNAQAGGSVERRHDGWQEAFEGRLKAQPAANLDQLNAWAEMACAEMNGSREHSRHGWPPLAVWTRIAPHQLKECPPRAMFFQLATNVARRGVLCHKLWLRADGQRWQIRGAGIHPSMVVSFKLTPFLDAGVRVWDPEGRELEA